MSQTAFRVPEMSCGGCSATIEGALEGLAGVRSVTVDLETKLVTVAHDDAVAPIAQLTGAIEDQGYEVSAHKVL